MSGSYATQVSTPQATVDVWTYEGGQYTLRGSGVQLLSVSVSKKINPSRPGTFSFLLAPGGPNGSTGIPSWTDILTPMSLVVIAMSRGGRANVVMVGVVLSVEETQDWTGRAPQRIISVEGQDFEYFFTNFTYYGLWWLSFAALVGAGPVLPSQEGLPASLGLFKSNSTPQAMGSFWLETVMLGASGLLGDTKVPYNGAGNQLSGVIAAMIDPFPIGPVGASSGQAVIPFGLYINLTNDETWKNKFNLIFPWPYYEFFVTTAPLLGGAKQSTAAASSNTIDVNTQNPTDTNQYLQGSLPGFQYTSGMPIASVGMPYAIQASPTMVARFNPQPWLPLEQAPNAAGWAPGNVDAGYWNLLPLTTPDGEGAAFIKSRFRYSIGEARNFYALRPTFLQALWGDSGGKTGPFLYSYLYGADAASVHRYGFRPAVSAVDWFSDVQGQAASAPGQPASINPMVAQLMARMAAQYEPEPLMGRATVTLPLRPDIFVGQRFRYQPKRDNIDWDFYVEGVTHAWRFGAAATTRLELSRGLPTIIYESQSVGGLLQAILQGNAYRQNGQWQSGLPAGEAGPAFIGMPATPAGVSQFAGALAAGYVDLQPTGF